MSRKSKPFVANRVNEIQSITYPLMWKHVPTKTTPEDLVSRGATVKFSTSHDLWLNGISFLQKPLNEWSQM